MNGRVISTAKRGSQKEFIKETSTESLLNLRARSFPLQLQTFRLHSVYCFGFASLTARYLFPSISLACSPLCIVPLLRFDWLRFDPGQIPPLRRTNASKLSWLRSAPHLFDRWSHSSILYFSLFSPTGAKRKRKTFLFLRSQPLWPRIVSDPKKRGSVLRWLLPN